MGNIVIVAGHSFVVGLGVYPEELPPEYAPNPLVRIMTPRGLEIMEPGVNTGTAANPHAWGPEVQIAVDWIRDRPGEDLVIVKGARGSSGLVSDPDAPDWSPLSEADLFAGVTDMVAEAKAQTGFAVAAVFFVQGHEDALRADAATAYADGLSGLFFQIRAQCADPDTLIVFGQLPDDASAPYRDLVREAQAQVAANDPLSIMVSSDGLSLQDDGLHPDGSGEIDLGGRLYAAYGAPAPIMDDVDPWLGVKWVESLGYNGAYW